MKTQNTHEHESSGCMTGGYMNARDLYRYFEKRLSLSRCHELLQTRAIRSACIGGRWLTRMEHVREFERTSFAVAEHQRAAVVTSGREIALAVAAQQVARRQAAQHEATHYAPLKKR
jgi:hypothetical protein